MCAAVRLREDYSAEDLRALGRRSVDAKQTRRLLSLAEIYDGGTRGDAARIGGVGLQVVRDREVTLGMRVDRGASLWRECSGGEDLCRKS